MIDLPVSGTPTGEAKQNILSIISSSLDYHQVVQSNLVRVWLRVWPLLIFLFIFYQLDNKLWVGPWLLALFSILVAGSSWGLLHRVKKPFVDLWKLEIVNIEAKEQYLTFVHDFRNDLNAKRQLVPAGLFAIIGIIAANEPYNWPWKALLSDGLQGLDAYVLWRLQYPVIWFWTVMYALTGWLIGLVVWRMYVINREIVGLSKNEAFKIRPIVGYPDKCGGLEPLGNLILWNGVISLIPALFLGIFAIIAPPYTEWFIFLLTVLILIAWLSFFRPLFSIHRVMRNRRDDEWARIGRRINELARSWPNQDGTPAAKRENEALDSELKSLTEHAALYPSWPLRSRPIIAFIAVEFVALLGLLTSIFDLIAS